MYLWFYLTNLFSIDCYLSNLEAVSIQPSAGLQDLQVTVPLDPQVVMDKEHHLLLVYLNDDINVFKFNKKTKKNFDIFRT